MHWQCRAVDNPLSKFQNLTRGPACPSRGLMPQRPSSGSLADIFSCVSCVQEWGIEWLSFLHQCPCDNKHLCWQLDSHFCLYPSFPFSATKFVREIYFEMFVLYWCNERGLIKCVSKTGFTLFWNHRNCGFWGASASAGAEIQSGHLYDLLACIESERVPNSCDNFWRDVRSETRNTQKDLVLWKPARFRDNVST